jgi:hypothetical protein
LTLKDTRWISELSQETGIPVRTLKQRVKKLIDKGKLIENKDYKKGEGKQPYLLDKSGIKKVLEEGR